MRSLSVLLGYHGKRLEVARDENKLKERLERALTERDEARREMKLLIVTGA